MKRIIRLFEGYFCLQALFMVAQTLDEREIQFTSPTNLLVDIDTGFPLESTGPLIAGYDSAHEDEQDSDAEEENLIEYSVRDELALIAHLKRGKQYSFDELAHLESRAEEVMDILVSMGLDLPDGFISMMEQGAHANITLH